MSHSAAAVTQGTRDHREKRERERGVGEMGRRRDGKGEDERREE